MGETTYMGVQLKVQPMLVGSIFSITELHFTYAHATLSAAYFLSCLLVESLDLLVSKHKFSLTWLLPQTESLGYTTYISAPP